MTQALKLESVSLMLLKSSAVWYCLPFVWCFFWVFWKKGKEPVAKRLSLVSCKKYKVWIPSGILWQIQSKKQSIQGYRSEIPYGLKKKPKEQDFRIPLYPLSSNFVTLTKWPFRKGQHVLSTKLCQMVFEATSNQTNCLWPRSQSLHPSAGRNKAFILRRPYQAKMVVNKFIIAILSQLILVQNPPFKSGVGRIPMHKWIEMVCTDTPITQHSFQKGELPTNKSWKLDSTWATNKTPHTFHCTGLLNT